MRKRKKQKKLIETANMGNYRLLLPRDEKLFEHFYDEVPNFLSGAT